MNSKLIETVFVNGENLDYILFKVAISFAETGKNVWYISPQQIRKVPKNIAAPSTEILKLLTFLYLQTTKELVEHLNAVHIWHKCPHLIIISGFETYDKDCNLATATLAIASALSATLACSRKHATNTGLLIACGDTSPERILFLQNLCDIYFSNVINKSNYSDDIIYEAISNILNK